MVGLGETSSLLLQEVGAAYGRVGQGSWADAEFGDRLSLRWTYGRTGGLILGILALFLMATLIGCGPAEASDLSDNWTSPQHILRYVTEYNDSKLQVHVRTGPFFEVGYQGSSIGPMVARFGEYGDYVDDLSGNATRQQVSAHLLDFGIGRGEETAILWSQGTLEGGLTTGFLSVVLANGSLLFTTPVMLGEGYDDVDVEGSCSDAGVLPLSNGTFIVSFRNRTTEHLTLVGADGVVLGERIELLNSTAYGGPFVSSPLVDVSGQLMRLVGLCGSTVRGFLEVGDPLLDTTSLIPLNLTMPVGLSGYGRMMLIAATPGAAVGYIEERLPNQCPTLLRLWIADAQNGSIDGMERTPAPHCAGGRVRNLLSIAVGVGSTQVVWGDRWPDGRIFNVSIEAFDGSAVEEGAPVPFCPNAECSIWGIAVAPFQGGIGVVFREGERNGAYYSWHPLGEIDLAVDGILKEPNFSSFPSGGAVHLAARVVNNGTLVILGFTWSFQICSDVSSPTNCSVMHGVSDAPLEPNNESWINWDVSVPSGRDRVVFSILDVIPLDTQSANNIGELTLIGDAPPTGFFSNFSDGQMAGGNISLRMSCRDPDLGDWTQLRIEAPDSVLVNATSEDESVGFDTRSYGDGPLLLKGTCTDRFNRSWVEGLLLNINNAAPTAYDLFWVTSFAPLNNASVTIGETIRLQVVVGSYGGRAVPTNWTSTGGSSVGIDQFVFDLQVPGPVGCCIEVKFRAGNAAPNAAVTWMIDVRGAALPPADFTTSGSDIVGQPVGFDWTLDGTRNAAGMSFRWTVDGEEVLGNSGSISYVFDREGSHKISLTVIGSGGQNSSEQSVEVVPMTTPFLTRDGVAVILVAAAIGGFSLWYYRRRDE